MDLGKDMAYFLGHPVGLGHGPKNTKRARTQLEIKIVIGHAVD